MAWAKEDPSSFAVKTYLQSANVLPVICRVDAIRTVLGNHATELTASCCLPQQGRVGIALATLPSSCVRQELPHEGPSFSAKYAGAKAFLC